MNKKISFVVIALLALTFCSCGAEPETIMPVKPSSNISEITDSSASSDITITATLDNSIDEIATPSLDESILVEEPVLGKATSYIACEIEATGQLNETNYESSWVLEMTEDERYISGSYGTEDDIQNVAAYYIFDNDNWTKYYNVNVDEGNVWQETSEYDSRLDVYDVCKALSFDGIEDATFNEGKMYVNGTYDISEYKESIQAYYGELDISTFDLTSTNIFLVEDSDKNIRKIEFCAELPNSDYIKFTIKPSVYNSSKSLVLPFS